MPSILAALRNVIYDRAGGQCEYCQTQSEVVNYNLEIDHIIPRSAGGTTTEHNLCLACRNCNGSKFQVQTGVEPETGHELSLFNPRTQKWDDHFMWSDDRTILIGLTAIGRATISRLKINRSLSIKTRQRWVSAGLHPPKKE